LYHDGHLTSADFAVGLGAAAVIPSAAAATTSALNIGAAIARVLVVVRFFAWPVDTTAGGLLTGGAFAGAHSEVRLSAAPLGTGRLGPAPRALLRLGARALRHLAGGRVRLRDFCTSERQRAKKRHNTNQMKEKFRGGFHGHIPSIHSLDGRFVMEVACALHHPMTAA
jgi:hypothetical protein